MSDSSDAFRFAADAMRRKIMEDLLNEGTFGARHNAQGTGFKDHGFSFREGAVNIPRAKGSVELFSPDGELLMIDGELIEDYLKRNKTNWKRDYDNGKF